MPTFRDVPCVYCNRTFTWQNDANPYAERICCHVCESKEPAGIICRFCGKHEDARYGNDQVGIVMKTCFNCRFWIDKLTKPREGRIVTPEYEHYVAGWWGIQQTQRPCWLGFGGRYWQVVMLDDSIRTTNNLWSQGSIPELWRPRFAPNVKSLKSIQQFEVIRI